jgi:hypothetical protein
MADEGTAIGNDDDAKFDPDTNIHVAARLLREMRNHAQIAFSDIKGNDSLLNSYTYRMYVAGQGDAFKVIRARRTAALTRSRAENPAFEGSQHVAFAANPKNWVADPAKDGALVSRKTEGQALAAIAKWDSYANVTSKTEASFSGTAATDAAKAPEVVAQAPEVGRRPARRQGRKKTQLELETLPPSDYSGKEKKHLPKRLPGEHPEYRAGVPRKQTSPVPEKVAFAKYRSRSPEPPSIFGDVPLHRWPPTQAPLSTFERATEERKVEKKPAEPPVGPKGERLFPRGELGRAPTPPEGTRQLGAVSSPRRGSKFKAESFIPVNSSKA